MTNTIYRLRLTKIISFFLIIPLMAGCATTSRTGRTSREGTSPGDFQLGYSVAREVEKEHGIIEDEKEIRRLNEIGLKVATAATSGEPLLYAFNIIDLEQANAFSLPGGLIYINRGLIELKLTDDEIAFLLGHEIVHAQERHAVKRMGANAFLTLLSIIALSAMEKGETGEGEYYAPGEMPARNAREVALAISQAILIQGYSRRQEMEADRLGLAYSSNAGYDPEAAITFFEKLAEKNPEKPMFFEGWVRSHPYLENRIREARENLFLAPPSQHQIQLITMADKIQKSYLQEASNYYHKEQYDDALLLYRNAWQISPSGTQAAEANFYLIKSNEKIQEKKEPAQRNYALLAVEYQKVIERYPDSNIIPAAKEAQEEMARESQKWYEHFITVMSERQQNKQFYKHFLQNYPDSEYAPQAHFGLAVTYHIDGMFDEAAKEYLQVREKFPTTDWSEKSMITLGKMITKIANPIVCYRMLLLFNDPSLQKEAREQMELITTEINDLEKAGEFLSQYPDNKYAQIIENKIDQLAANTYLKALTYENTGEKGKAREEYKKIINNAPNTRYAKQAKERLKKF